MNLDKPLLQDGSNNSIEFSLREGKAQFEGHDESLTAIGFFQLLDLSQNYETMLGQVIPSALYPKQANNFNLTKKSEKTIPWLENIPVFIPDSWEVMTWQFFMVLIIFAYFFYIPYKIAFTHEYTYSDENPAVETFLILSIILLTIDLGVSFNIAIYRHGQLIKDRKIIAYNYLQWAFELDLIGVLSLLIALIFYQLVLIRLLFFFRGYYIIRYFNKVEHLLQLKPRLKAALKITELVIVILLVTHIMACIFFGTAQGQINNGEPTWIYYNSYMYNDEPVITLTIWEQYVTSFYWSLTTISTVGYGDITPKNDQEIFIALVTMVIAGMIFAFNVSSIREIFQELNQSQVRYNQFEQVLNQYMKIKQIQPNTQIRVKEYFDYVWEEEKNRDHTAEQNLLQRLAPDLREQVCYEAYRNFLGSFLFVNQGYSEAFLRSISQVMEEQDYGPGDTINGGFGEKYLYYLNNGCALIYLERKNTYDPEMKIDVITKGKCFGQISFFTGEPNSFHTKSIGCSSVYRLARTKFLELIQNFDSDFQIYHLLLSQRNQPEFYQKLDIICLTCGRYGHYPTHCPVTHYIPNKKKLFNQCKIRKIHVAVRQPFKRNNRKQVKSLDIINNVKNNAHQYQSQVKQIHHLRKSALIKSFNHDFDDDEFYQIEEEENVDNELDEIKNMLQQVMLKLGIERKSNIKAPAVAKPFIPSRPTYDPPEKSFDIDLLQNYDVFQPQYNYTTILHRLGYE